MKVSSPKDNPESFWLSKVSLGFIKRFRVTLLILFSVLIIGVISYTTLLKREGFPAVEFPGVVLQVPYFVGDEQKVNSDVTVPIENAIADLPQIKSITSTTTENFTVIFVEFEQGTTSKDGARLLREEIEAAGELPQTARVEYQTINAASVDGTHDLVFTISGDQSTQELQKRAAEVAEEVGQVDVIAQANVIELIEKQTNPLTGEQFDHQSGFRRVGIKKDGKVVFQNAVQIGVMKKGDVGSLDLSDGLREKIDQMREDGRLDGIEVTYGGDLADDLRLQISSLEESALLGLIIVTTVLLLFVNWRSALVIAFFIPLVLSATFIGFFLIGYSLNVLSLFALILVLGLFVDDAIVIVEAIDHQKKEGEKGIQAIAKAIKAVGVADLSGTFTTLFVFVPLAFISGILGDFIRLIPVTIILSLALSLLMAMTLIPFITSLVVIDEDKRDDSIRKIQRLLNKTIGKQATKFVRDVFLALRYVIFYLVGDIVNKLGVLISRFVKFYLSHVATSLVVFLFTIALIIFGLAFSTQLKFSIFAAPKDSEGLYVNITFLPGTSVQEAEQRAREVESMIVNEIGGEVKQVNYFIANDTSAMIAVDLTEMGEREETMNDLVDKLNESFENYDKARVKASPESVGPPTDEYPFMMQIYAQDNQTLVTASEQIKAFINGREVDEGHKVADVIVDNLDNTSKIDGRRYVQVRAKISGEVNTGVIFALRDQVEAEFNNPEKLDELGLEDDALGFDLGQESENAESFNSSIFALLIAIVLIYGLLVFQFNSYTQPLLILLAIPLSFPGVFPGLYLTDNPLSFFVMIGLTGLVGIVINNSIMLVDYANQQKAKGMKPSEAIAEAVRLRFRPLVTTSVTAIAGMAPLALTEPFWEPLAFTIMFGLMASTTLVILCFPVLYMTIEYIKRTEGFKVHLGLFAFVAGLLLVLNLVAGFMAWGAYISLVFVWLLILLLNGMRVSLLREAFDGK